MSNAQTTQEETRTNVKMGEAIEEYESRLELSAKLCGDRDKIGNPMTLQKVINIISTEEALSLNHADYCLLKDTLRAMIPEVA